MMGGRMETPPDYNQPMDGQQRCKTCGHPGPEGHNYRHPFNYGQDGATSFLGPKKDKDKTQDQKAKAVGTAPGWPIDPVLRTALINKGVITPQDLRDAEDLIRATTQQFEATVRESRHGQGEVQI